MARLRKELSDLVKRGQGSKCGNRKSPYGKEGKPASIKSGGHIYHKDGNPENNNINNLIALLQQMLPIGASQTGKRLLVGILAQAPAVAWPFDPSSLSSQGRLTSKGCHYKKVYYLPSNLRYFQSITKPNMNLNDFLNFA